MNYRSQDFAKAIVLEANEAYFNAERRRQNHGGPRAKKISREFFSGKASRENFSREIFFWEGLP